MKELTYIFLGAGGIAHHHHSCAKQIAGLRLVGVYDTSEASMEAWLKKEPGILLHRDPRKLLSLTKPDIAVICSPNVAHAQLTQIAFEAGCHVICEKPMAMTVPEALKMEAARVKARKLGAINFSYRYVPSFRLAREIVASGELGRIQRMNVRYLQSFLGAESQPYSWRNDAKVAGFGALGDLGVHMIDGASFVSGEEPAKVAGVAQTLVPWKRDAKGKKQKVTTDTNASFIIQYASGALGVFETSQVVPGYGNFFQIEISGDKGVARILSEDGEHVTLYSSPTLSHYDNWGPEAFPKVKIPTGFANNQPRSTFDGFTRKLRGEKSKADFAGFDTGITAQKCIAAIHQSMITDRWIKVVK
ncbi:Gfo/Idh/MocA family oxidoreductase [Kamptonema cortianum]|nr:Gfo/Idh/MocA family oxidoreductase [Oscillatoria laete-virens]MDK3159411.1 Gfo/Idh/MocA family oxidoreductase [Kamptonema cortianum]MDL5050439.1 Gfo/Idh/MocA family oxidoreductase [Oscillatoria amoena NRMC-F 0135]MDL5054164.1 Gfo/Idh/MocA family oxidoreductase [Oscillatoria laete-virens NRMC-F 0139]